MKVKLISFANRPFFRSQKILKESAFQYGVDEVVNYNDIWLRAQKDFYEKNKAILASKKGVGYWLWKPFIMLDALKSMNEDDVLVLIDAGTTFIDNIQPLIPIVQNKEIVVFYNNEHKNKYWTKRDCFLLMNCDEPSFHESVQVLGGYILCKKTPFVINLLNEWLHFCQDIRIISDELNVCGKQNLEGFKEHRHDQSILSNLAIKYQIELFREPSQWGNHFKMPEFRRTNEFVCKDYIDGMFHNSYYPTILNGHRKKIPLTFFDKLQYFILNFKNIKTT